MKICSKCELEKDECEFRVRKNRPCGFSSSCKNCLNITYQYQEYDRRYSSQYFKTPKGKSVQKKFAQSQKGRLLNQQTCNRRRERKLNLDSQFTKDHAKLVYKRFNNKCFNCNAINHLAIDHHYPLSRGYGLTLKNAVLLCRSCNASKLDSMPEEFYTQEQLRSLAEILV